jgi:hypothetical protein
VIDLIYYEHVFLISSLARRALTFPPSAGV